MEIVVKGHNAEVSDRFRTHVVEKLEKVEQYAPRAQRVEVEITHEPNPAQAETAQRIEITVRDKGPVVRAEAVAADRLSALDLATQKLYERLRRKQEKAQDRRRQSPPRDFTPTELPVNELMSNGKKENSEPAEEHVVPTTPGETVETQLGDSPVVVRQKLYEARPMTVEQAIDEMELVGHPFFLFIDSGTSQPCVAYRRRGWTYGILRLDATATNFGPGDES